MMLTGDREGSVKGQKALVEKDEENGDGEEEVKSAAGRLIGFGCFVERML